MLITNPGKPITSTIWYMLELRSEKTSEETIKRIGKAMKGLFVGEMAELFVPVIERDLDTFTLLTECYVFVRADDVQKIAKLRQVTGVHGVLSKAESLQPSKFLQVEDDYVQGLIQQCWTAHHARAVKIRVGSWVRLIDGQTRNYCGSVVSIHGDRAMVKVDVKTKVYVLETNLHNLLDLSHVPDAHRVFYYSDPVKTFLAEHGAEAETMLKQDLAYDEVAAKAFLMVPEETEGATSGSTPQVSRHTSREQTPTRFVESMLMGGERDVRQLLHKTVIAIRAGTIRTPKNAMILWHVIRGSVVKILMPPATGGAKPPTYTKLLEIFGDSFQLTPRDVHAAIPELPFRRLAGKVVVTPAEAMPVPKPPAVLRGTVTVVHADIPHAGLIRPTVVLREALTSSLERPNLTPVIEKLIVGIYEGRVKAPKHLRSLASVIRNVILQHYRVQWPNSTIDTLTERFGPGLRNSLTDLRIAFPGAEALIAAQYALQNAPKLPKPSVITVVPDTPLPTPKRRDTALKGRVTTSPL